MQSFKPHGLQSGQGCIIPHQKDPDQKFFCPFVFHQLLDLLGGPCAIWSWPWSFTAVLATMRPKKRKFIVQHVHAGSHVRSNGIARRALLPQGDRTHCCHHADQQRNAAYMYTSMWCHCHHARRFVKFQAERRAQKDFSGCRCITTTR